MTTLNEVFLKLEGKSMADESGKGGALRGMICMLLLAPALGKLREDTQS